MFQRRSFFDQPKPETILTESPVGRSTVRKLWKRKLRTGEEVEAAVFLASERALLKSRSSPLSPTVSSPKASPRAF
jgi:hypothetical protein